MIGTRRTLATAILAGLVSSAWAAPDSRPPERSVVADGGARVNPVFRTAGTPPPPAPGIAFSNTIIELQHVLSSGRQVARNVGADIVHFIWTFNGHCAQSDWECEDRFVSYSSYAVSTGSFNQPYNGVTVSLGVYARAGYSTLAVDQNNTAHAAFHQRAEAGSPYSTFHLYFPNLGSAYHVDTGLATTTTFGELIWPQIEVQQNAGGTDICHVVSHSSLLDSSFRIVYWRFNGSSWEGPIAVDSNPLISYVVAADPNSDNAAIVITTNREPPFHGLENIAYYESQTQGAGWISGTELGDANKVIVTSYSDSSGSQAWGHISAAYDNSSVLHIIWDEQRYAGSTAQDAIRHWNTVRGTTRTVAEAYWDNPASTGGYNLNLAKITLGIGDGATLCQGGAESNRDYLYVVYTRFGGTTPPEQTDYSALGYMNGELYLNVSRDGGQTWSRPQNLTNTKTPHCNPGSTPVGGTNPPRPDSVCRSEHWAAIGKLVHDIDIFFISDNDAGAFQLGEGGFLINLVMYRRIPGGTTDAPYLCPRIEPWLASALGDGGVCGFHPGWTGVDSTMLTIANLGNGTLEGTVAVAYVDPPDPTSNWLSVAGAQSLPITIPAGGDDLSLPVVMVATGLDTDSNTAEIRITHNDTTQPDPFIIPVLFAPGACRCHADPVCDGQTSILDVVGMVNRAFRGEAAVVDPGCPHTPPVIDGRSDVDCNGRTDVTDVVKMIDVAFRAATPTTRFCDPCL